MSESTKRILKKLSKGRHILTCTGKGFSAIHTGILDTDYEYRIIKSYFTDVLMEVGDIIDGKLQDSSGTSLQNIVSSWFQHCLEETSIQVVGLMQQGSSLVRVRHGISGDVYRYFYSVPTEIRTTVESNLYRKLKEHINGRRLTEITIRFEGTDMVVETQYE